MQIWVRLVPILMINYYSVVHIIRIRLIRIFAYFEKTLGPTIETIQKIRMEKYG